MSTRLWRCVIINKLLYRIGFCATLSEPKGTCRKDKSRIYKSFWRYYGNLRRLGLRASSSRRTAEASGAASSAVEATCTTSASCNSLLLAPGSGLGSATTASAEAFEWPAKRSWLMESLGGRKGGVGFKCLPYVLGVLGKSLGQWGQCEVIRPSAR